MLRAFGFGISAPGDEPATPLRALYERREFSSFVPHHDTDPTVDSSRRYQAGKASYFKVLDAQLQLYPEQNALAQTELNRRLVVVQLYLALGGGWNLTDSDWENQTITPGSSSTGPTTAPGVKP